MAKYVVAICRSAYNYITVEAGSEGEAREKAADIFDSRRVVNPPDRIGEDYDTMVVDRKED